MNQVSKFAGRRWLVIAAAIAVGGGIALALRARRATRNAAVAVEATVTKRARTSLEIAQPIYERGFKQGWNESAALETSKPGEPWRVSFSGFARVSLEHAEQAGDFGALVLRFKAPPEHGEFLQVSLRHQADDERWFPAVPVTAQHIADLPDGWSEALIPFRALDPSGAPFDHVVIEARRMVSGALVELDGLGLTKPAPTDGAPRSGYSRPSSVRIDCSAEAKPISPLIYGIARGVVASGETAHRVGGNAMTRLNWEAGNLWNTGSDWFFENVQGDNAGLPKWLDDARGQGLQMALSVPMIGWVAKDGSSFGFPAQKYPKQQKFDPNRPQAGNGLDADGKPLSPGLPSQTSEAAPPARIQHWVEAVVAREKAAGKRSVALYMLDNEPDLWHRTHRDVHPEPLSYDELLEKTLAYGAAVRAADPEAVIAGPASWGWTGYFFSPKDQETGFHLNPDRRSHQNLPLIAWYLQQLADHERRTGKHILDVLDVHYYPQAAGVYGGNEATDARGAALRIRSTRSLWDASYRDESWIGESVELLPRLQRWVDENYPGRGVALGEWSFGGENHVSGALATAEALGRFGQHGLKAAFYWASPAAGTPTFWAFRAYRNYDGKGAAFQDLSLPTQAPTDVSAFASRNEESTRLVVVILNLDASVAHRVSFELRGCGEVRETRAFSYAGGPDGLSAVKSPSVDGIDSPPYSLQVVELTLSR